MIGGGRVLRIDAADAAEGLRVAFEHAGEVAVVPFVVADLDDNGADDIVGRHEFEELFDGCIFGGWFGFAGEGEFGIVLPYMDVRVDER